MRINVPFLDTRSSPAEAAFGPRELPSGGAHPDSGGLRILHILRAPVGGLFRHVCDLAEEQTRMGHFVGIVCDSRTGGDQAKAQLLRILPWCRLGIRRIRMSRTLTLGDADTLARVRRHVARIAPDIVHGHGAKGGAYARLLPRAPGRVALYTPHGGALHYDWRTPAGALFLALERFLMARSDGILFESRFGQRAYAAKVGDAKCPTRVVPNGLGQADFAPLPEGEPPYDAVFVGELRTLKGVGTLIEAAAGIARDRPFRVAIAGTGPDEGKFRAQVEQMGLGESVAFLGHRPAREIFAMGRAIVVPSLAESFPYIVLEAMAAGRPLIATRVGGIPEIFGPDAGTLVSPGDPATLATAIAAAMQDRGGRHSLALRLKSRIRASFSVDTMVDDIIAAYCEALARRNG